MIMICGFIAREVTNMGFRHTSTPRDVKQAMIPLRYSGASESKNRKGPMMLPAATPKKTAAEASAFLVVPPRLPETSERPTTKVAFEAPVIPMDAF